MPAIPKAYESPKSEIGTPFFSARKSSLPFDVGSVNSTSTGDFISIQGSDSEPVRAEEDFKYGEDLGAGDRKDDNKRAGMPTNNNRRTLQPLRLPPLNLLPLSTPTEAKILALQDKVKWGPGHPGAVTPPPRKGPAKTPSTPMTASKTSFFSRHHYEEDMESLPVQIRSTSSHYRLRSETSSQRADTPL